MQLWGVGCLDPLCSASGIKRQGLQAIKQFPDSKLAPLYHKQGNLSAKDIMDLAKKGDETCLAIINRTSNILGMVFANIASTVNPAVIIVGGGVSKSGDFFSVESGSLQILCNPKIKQSL